MAGGFVENFKVEEKLPPATTDPQAAVSRTWRKFFQVFFTVTEKKNKLPHSFCAWVGGRVRHKRGGGLTNNFFFSSVLSFLSILSGHLLLVRAQPEPP
ncbi:MAG: hypothetical protein LBC52_04130 [Treponema sp.]|nr:hypothetical protein [Treponema sp.]